MPRGANNLKPTNLKVIQGTFRKDRAPANEIKPKPALTLDVPKGLDQSAKRTWRQLAPILRKLGLLTEADLHSFVALCEAWSRFERARRRARVVLTQRMKYTAEHLDLIRKVEVSVERAEHSWRQLSAEFGLTPAARSRLDVWAPPSEEDEFQEFLRGSSA